MKDFMSEDQIKANIGLKQLGKGLWPYCKRHLGLFFAAIFSVLILALASRLLPTLIGQAIDQGIGKQDYQALKAAAIAFLVIEVILTIAQYARIYLFLKLGNRVLFYIREDLVRHLQTLPIQYFNKNPIGRIVTRLSNDTSTLGEVFSEGVIAIFTEFIVLISILVAMLMISVKLTLSVLALAPIFIWISYRVSEEIKVILRDAKKKLSMLNSYVAENLNGVKVIQLYNRVERNRERFSFISQEYRDEQMKSIKRYALLQPTMNLFNAVTITGALYFGGLAGAEGSLALGTLVAFIMHAQDVIRPLRTILEKYQQFQNSLTSAERVFQLLDEKSEDENSAVETSQPTQQIADHPVNGEIRFDDLSFQYESHLPMVLKNISLTVPAGKSLAIVGRTGSGKSTLINLLQRFYNSPEKSLFIDNVPIEQIPRPILRQYVGVVQQDSFIFRGTIRDNISLGDVRITSAQVEEACRKVGYFDLLQRSHRGLDTFLEERGANISVGERQLIAFARILAFQPQILILDEATANIDSESEKIIQEATKEITKGRTSLIIAHRLSTIEDCDLILVLDQGQIREVGTHKELTEKKGYYYRYGNECIEG
ncbi:MAG: ABC transporter ATP-binding protein [Oligoflexia bacterium]|nr:MAG: ABC transporter ATP-binding protein [Oligoflexia bacterium]